MFLLSQKKKDINASNLKITQKNKYLISERW